MTYVNKYSDLKYKYKYQVIHVWLIGDERSSISAVILVSVMVRHDRL